MIKEFKEFISKGNVLNLAIGVVMGTAFSGIVTSLVNDIIMPLVGLIIGGIDFTGMKATVGDASITYGNFIQNIVNFLIISLSSLFSSGFFISSFLSSFLSAISFSFIFSSDFISIFCSFAIIPALNTW